MGQIVIIRFLWARAYARGVGLKKTLEIDILQKLITCAKVINCFRIPLLVICRLSANTTE